eukprot:1161775-Rhodomonas_salina.1
MSVPDPPSTWGGWEGGRCLCFHELSSPPVLLPAGFRAVQEVRELSFYILEVVDQPIDRHFCILATPPAASAPTHRVLHAEAARGADLNLLDLRFHHLLPCLAPPYSMSVLGIACHAHRFIAELAWCCSTFTRDACALWFCSRIPRTSERI